MRQCLQDLQQQLLRVGNCYLEVLPGGTGVVAWVLPGVLPGYTWCYLECYLVLLGVTWVVILGNLFFCGPKIPLNWLLLLKVNIGKPAVQAAHKQIIPNRMSVSIMKS